MIEFGSFGEPISPIQLFVAYYTIWRALSLAKWPICTTKMHMGHLESGFALQIV
eukprot:c40585_g1_i1 orf=1-159(-)